MNYFVFVFFSLIYLFFGFLFSILSVIGNLKFSFIYITVSRYYHLKFKPIFHKKIKAMFILTEITW